MEPGWYFLDGIHTKEGIPFLYIRVNWNIELVEISEPEPHTEWQYDSIVLAHKPSLVLKKADIRSYIETHEAELKSEAVNKWNSEAVTNANITEVREQPIVPDYEERIFTEKEVYGATVMEIDVTRQDKRYVKAKLLKRNVEKWCYVTGSVLRDYTESKIGVGDVVIVVYDSDNNYPVVVDRAIL